MLLQTEWQVVKASCPFFTATNEGQELQQKQPVIDKAEATALALGIAKLMKFKQFNGSSNSNTASLEESGELVAKHLDADFSCFLCRKKCRTRARFFVHFKRHFNKVNKVNSSSSDDDDQEERDSVNGDPTFLSAIHLRGLSDNKSHHHRRRHQRPGFKKRPSGDQAEHDGDSGCHSVESSPGGSSSNGTATSDCPGDSESSDSDSDLKKSRQLERCISKKASKSGKSVSLKDRLSLAEKQLDNNETEGLICMTCLKRFSNCQNLRRHLRLHIARDSIKPDFEVDTAGSDREDDEDGLFSVTGGKHLCDWCPAKFDNRSAARIHESTHRGQEPKCYVCSKHYADRYSLRYHLRTHGIGRQIRCEYCNKAFSKPSRLAAHVRSHHKNIRDFACPSCDKAFKTRVHLTNHYRQHSGEKPFECPVCQERFRHKASMISHSRKHDGERPYCCEVCGKTFREPSTLKAHSRVHTGDKPYTCPDCGKSFTQRAGLNYHRKASHEGSRPHACKLCPFATVKAASLTAHYRNIHQTDKPVPLPLLTPPMETHGDDATSSPTISCGAETQPLPSFDNLKTNNTSEPGSESNAYGQMRIVTQRETATREASPPLTPPSSSSTPASSTTTSSSGMEDFLPNMAEATDDFLPSLNMSELTSQLDYGTYDYHTYRQQSSMYHQHQSHMMQHQHQQWFGYSSQDMQMSSYPYGYNGGYFSSTSSASTGGGGSGGGGESSGGQATYHQQSMMATTSGSGFSGGGNNNSSYSTYNNNNNNNNNNDSANTSTSGSAVTAPSHPSYCI
jgi:uncharacterized Zn-finger protein